MELTWHILFVAGIVLMVIEVWLPWMIMFPLGLALVMTAPVSWFTSDIGRQATCFVVFSAINVVVLRKWVSLKRAARAPDSALDYLIGKESLVVQTIDATGRLGSVRYENKSWRAVSQMAETLVSGTKVIITNVDDSKVIVLPKGD